MIIALGGRVSEWGGAAMRWKAHSKSVLRSKARLPPAEPVRARQAGLPELVQAAKITATTSAWAIRSEEHTSELQSLMRISYAVFCLKKKTAYHSNRTRPSQTLT